MAHNLIASLPNLQFGRTKVINIDIMRYLEIIMNTPVYFFNSVLPEGIIKI